MAGEMAPELMLEMELSPRKKGGKNEATWMRMMRIGRSSALSSSRKFRLGRLGCIPGYLPGRERTEVDLA